MTTLRRTILAASTLTALTLGAPLAGAVGDGSLGAQQPGVPGQPGAGARPARMRQAPEFPRVAGGGPAAMLLRARGQLNLTDDQVKRLEALATAQGAAVRPDRGAQLRLQADLADAMKGEGNLDAARKALTALNAQRTERALAQLRMRQEARGVLTPEQRAKADALRDGLMQRRAAMQGGRRGFGPGRGGMWQGGRGPGRGRGPDGFGPPGQFRRPGFPDAAPRGWRRPPEGSEGSGIVPGTI